MERPTIKDKSILEYVEHLEKELEVYKRSPYVSTYIAIYNQIQDWNQQITPQYSAAGEDNPIQGSSAVESWVNSNRKGKIDLFADKDQKEFERVFKYFGEVGTILKQLEEIRKLMNPAEQKKIEEMAKAGNVGIAERMAVKEKNGTK